MYYYYPLSDKRLTNLNQDNSTRTGRSEVMGAKPLILCVWDGLVVNQATLQVFIFSSKRSCGIQNHLLGWVLFTSTQKEKSTPHWFKGFWNVIFCHLDMMESAVVSQAWLVGGVGDTEGWRLPRCDPTRHICRGKQIWHRWSVWQEKDMATRQEKQMEKPI